MRALIAAVSAAVLTAAAPALAPGAVAAPETTVVQPKPPPPPKRVFHQLPAKRPATGDVGTHSASSGGQSGDFTGDGNKDILARLGTTLDPQNLTGQLRVYPHSGTYNGPATYLTSVPINDGWGAMRWIGQGRMVSQGNQPRKVSDVIAIQSNGEMWVHTHSGTFNGRSTLNSKVLISTGWPAGDLVYTYDWNGDGFDDVLRRDSQAASPNYGNTLVYLHSKTWNGLSTLLPPTVVASGGQFDAEQNMADVTADGYPDLLYLQPYDGGLWLSVYDIKNNQSYALGTGWQITNAMLVTDVNNDSYPDILARWNATPPPGENQFGYLKAFQHSRSFVPDPYGRAYGVLLEPVVIGTNWDINNVIT